MEFGEPPLARLKYPVISLASLFAAYCFFRLGTDYLGWGMVGAVVLAVGGWAIFGFLQGFAAIVSMIGFPLLSYFTDLFGTLGYWLGGLSLVVFLLTQFRYVRRA